MEAEVTAAAETSNRRRLMFNGKSVLAMIPSWNEGAWRYPLYFAEFSATSPFPGDHRACGSRLVESASPRLDAGRRMEQREKRSQVSSVSTEGKITGGGRLRQEALEGSSLVPSDVPDGLTIINGYEIAAQFENSEDYRHL